MAESAEGSAQPADVKLPPIDKSAPYDIAPCRSSSAASLPPLSRRGSVTRVPPAIVHKSREAAAMGSSGRKTLHNISNPTPKLDDLGSVATTLDEDGERNGADNSDPKAPAISSPTFVKVAFTATSNPTERLVPPSSVRQRVFNLLEPGMPTWSQSSANLQTALSLSILMVIVVSVACFCVETMPQYYEVRAQSLVWTEGVCVIIFTVEFLLRLLCCSQPVAFFKDFLNLIDLVSILPWYVTLIVKLVTGGNSKGVSTLIVFRVIRLVRVFRVLKLSKYSINLQLVAIAVARSFDALGLLLFLIVICLLLFSSGVFLADQTVMSFDSSSEQWVHVEDGVEERAPFQSIPHTFWWCIVTLTTVGYGDNVPVSWLGKGIASLTMLCGILVAAFPVILIGNNFNEAVEDHRRKAKQHAEMLQRMLGQEPSNSDEPPDAYACDLEMRMHLEVLKTDLEKEFERVGVDIALSTHSTVDISRGITPGTSCASFMFSAQSYIITFFSYGNQPLALAETQRSVQPQYANRGSLLNTPLKFLVKRFNQKQRELTEAQQELDKVSVHYQFRYDPLFQVRDVQIYDDAGIRFMKLEIVLDSPVAQECATEALRTNESCPKIVSSNVCARQLRQLTGTLEGLEELIPTSQVQCKAMRPGNSVAMTILCSSSSSLRRLEEVLPMLNIQLTYQYLHQSDSRSSSTGSTCIPVFHPRRETPPVRRMSTCADTAVEERMLSRLESAKEQFGAGAPKSPPSKSVSPHTHLRSPTRSAAPSSVSAPSQDGGDGEGAKAREVPLSLPPHQPQEPQDPQSPPADTAAGTASASESNDRLLQAGGQNTRARGS